MAQHYPLKHIAQGVETLLALDRHGLLTNLQVADLLFCDRPNQNGQLRTERGAQAAASRTLQRLWQNGLIARQRVVLTSRRTSGPYIHFVNILSSDGAQVVRAYHLEAATGKTLRWSKAAADLSHQQLEHAVAINGVYALAARAATQAGMTIGAWRDDRQLAAMNRTQETNFVSLPDGFFVLSQGETAYGHFLELDRGTETVFGLTLARRDWQGKISGYEAYFQDRYAAEPFFDGVASPIVLTVTTSPQRLAHLLEATPDGGGERYWYTTIDVLDPLDHYPRGSTFWKPIWRVKTDGELRSLQTRVRHGSAREDQQP